LPDYTVADLGLDCIEAWFWRRDDQCLYSYVEMYGPNPGALPLGLRIPCRQKGVLMCSGGFAEIGPG
jgi:hypothetical protein